MKNTLKYALTAVFGASMMFVMADAGAEGAHGEHKAEHAAEHKAEHKPKHHSKGSKKSKAHKMPKVAGHGTAAMPTSENFPDVPKNHWVYEGLAKLKANGVAAGYPDGLFRGDRTPTRYEMAEMVSKAWAKLKGMADGHTSQIEALTEKLNSMGDVKADIAALRDQLAEHKKTLDSMKPWGDDIAFLKKAADEFKAELGKMGVDINALKKDMATLEGRVLKLEQRRHTVEISGDANVLAIAGMRGNRNSCSPGLLCNGRVVGVGKDGFEGQGVRSRDINLMHELAVRLTSTNEYGPVFNGTVVMGNALGGSTLATGENPIANGLGSQSANLLGQPFRVGPQDLYIQDLTVKAKTSSCNWELAGEVGRFRHSIDSNPYMFSRNAYHETYYKNPRWNDGLHTIDGGIVKIGAFGARLDVWGGMMSRTDRQVTSIQGVEINPLIVVDPTIQGSTIAGTPAVPGVDAAGRVSKVDHTFGARLNVPVGEWGAVNLAYLLLDSNVPFSATVGNTTHTINRVGVYGGDATINFAKYFSLHGGVSKTPYMTAGSFKSVFNRNNTAYWAQVGFDNDRAGLMGGYKQVDQNFAAPGSWDKIGTDWNPRNIKGAYASGYFNITPAWKISANGQFVSNVDRVAGLRRPSHYTVKGQLDFQVCPKTSLMASAEFAEFNARRSERASRLKQSWFTVGGTHKFSKEAALHAGFQWGRSDNVSRHFETVDNLEVDDARHDARSSWLQARDYRGGAFYTHVIFRF
jgi:hypothetical protein